ncbi:MAG TPA: NADH-quinone oxidoreductase subunit L [Candidatus Binataceae bacterium]|nr:NADH-quinone oxidoreductase subunit L [Candidatus Binataceae bacterium]
MTQNFPALGLILLFPALGVIFNLFWGNRAGRSAVNFVGPAVVFISFGLAVWAFFTLLQMPPGSALTFILWRWIQAGPFHVELGLRIDALSAVMILVVTGVGSFILLFSVGYMGHDEDYARYFTYMNLFVFSMLILVLADNLLEMFVGWEGVGLCSYLLIAFWYYNPQFAYNGRKAFIVNRIGDAGFVLGILTIVSALAAHNVWTLNFVQMQHHAGLLEPVAVLAGLLLFLGATGKSAQIPLYVWLPDAMVGPTPVSALIHAATMVTAGVYMVARLHFLYIFGPEAMEVVAAIGAVTAFFAATIAIVQADIKRVLAYSTISQIGYMMLGVGSGAFAAGIFHLMTHAFFKSLLFLCSGSIIHVLEGEQDMNKMGGLRHQMPITFATMLIAALAISAIPPFAGYFSKDLVLEGAYASGHVWLWIIGVITAGLTSFYMFRLIFMTFYGESRVDHEKVHHVHESPPVMTIPLIVLAVACILGGWVGLPDWLLWGDAFKRFLAPVFAFGMVTPGHVVLGGAAALPQATSITIGLIALGLGVLGIVIAWILYIQNPALPARIGESLHGIYSVLWHKYYIDELYNLFVTRPLFWLSAIVLSRTIDTGIIDGIVNGTGLVVEESGEGVRRGETGNVQHYAFVYLIGVLGVAAYYVYLVMR